MYRKVAAAAALAVGLIMPGLVLGQDCRTLADVRYPIAHELAGDDAAVWLNAFNAVPPVSDVSADTVVLTVPMATRYGIRVFVYPYRDGCMVGPGWHLGLGIANALIAAVLGE